MGRTRKFLSLINPLSAARDLRNQLVEPRPHRWPVMGVAAAATFAIFSVMFQEGSIGMPLPPTITYFESWRDDRSDAEIIAGNVIATQVRKVREAEQAAGAERVRQAYKTLGRASGMDVEAIERRARAKQSEEASVGAERTSPVEQ